MKSPIWPLRILILVYFIYKFYFSEPSGPFSDFEFEGKPAGRIVGEIIANSILLSIIGLFFFYQIKQGWREMRGDIEIKKARFRMYSIVFSIFFNFLFAISLINVDFSNIEITRYLLDLYTLFTFIAVIAAAIVITKDIQLFRTAKQKQHVL